MQEGKPLAFYSRTLNQAQRNYTTGEQELLSVVETLKEYKNILLGQKVIIHTDHKNILYSKLPNERITRWRLMLEEYGPEFQHVSGKDNIVADALSRLDTSNGKGTMSAFCMSAMIRDESYEMPRVELCLAADDANLERFPMKPSLIAAEQKKDARLQKAVKSAKADFKNVTIEDEDLLTLNGKIVIPISLQHRIVAWYHKYLAHPGQTRLEQTLRSAYYWKGIKLQVERHVRRCKQCQLYKANSKSYGYLPPKRAESAIPWKQINVDLIGPLEVKTPKGIRKLRAITIIDPATGWFEMKEIAAPDAANTSAAIDDVWFCRYPRPQIIGFDGGSEFKGLCKETALNYGLKTITTTAYNPQSNGIIERVHQVLNDAL
jgi:hypothetical protein